MPEAAIGTKMIGTKMGGSMAGSPLADGRLRAPGLGQGPVVALAKTSGAGMGDTEEWEWSPEEEDTTDSPSGSSRSKTQKKTTKEKATFKAPSGDSTLALLRMAQSLMLPAALFVGAHGELSDAVNGLMSAPAMGMPAPFFLFASAAYGVVDHMASQRIIAAHKAGIKDDFLKALKDENAQKGIRYTYAEKEPPQSYSNPAPGLFTSALLLAPLAAAAAAVTAAFALAPSIALSSFNVTGNIANFYTTLGIACTSLIGIGYVLFKLKDSQAAALGRNMFTSTFVDGLRNKGYNKSFRKALGETDQSWGPKKKNKKKAPAARTFSVTLNPLSLVPTAARGAQVFGFAVLLNNLVSQSGASGVSGAPMQPEFMVLSGAILVLLEFGIAYVNAKKMNNNITQEAMNLVKNDEKVRGAFRKALQPKGKKTGSGPQW